MKNVGKLLNITNIVVKGSVKMCSSIFQQPFLSMPKFGMLPEKAESSRITKYGRTWLRMSFLFFFYFYHYPANVKKL